ALLDNARPNQSRVDGARGDVRRLNEQLSELNDKMTDASQGENSLAQLNVRIQMAQADLATRDMLLQSALQQMEQTRMEANRQVRYLTVSVKPVPSEEPSYPRKFENTIVAFLIFAGIYLMVSLTASILREQVTS
ncbi:MAG: capsule biosynthesis protein, partial [Pseudomonadota bacterium]